MELEKLKEKSIESFLQKNGFDLKRSVGKYNWYLSPLRKESEPSFAVDREKNKWVDFGNGEHGSILDLIMSIRNCSFKDACFIIENEESEIKSYVPEKKIGNSIEIVDVKKVTNKKLINYAKSRKINEEIIDKYLKQVYYRFNKNDNKSRTYFAIGFENNMGGFELRSEKTKISVSPKSYTRFDGNDSKYFLFEGFFDFLSALMFYGVDKFEYTTYILNGVSQINALKPFLENKIGYFFVDNDEAGTKCISGLAGHDMRFLFEGYNDFNEMMCKSL